MPLLNYTTTVPATRTIAQIMDLLVRAGATQILSEHQSGRTTGISFAISGPTGLQRYRLPADIGAVEKVLVADRHIERRYKTTEHAERVAWRILKDWVEAQLAIIATKMVTLDQVFLPYMLLGGDQTVYDLYVEQRLALPPG